MKSNFSFTKAFIIIFLAGNICLFTYNLANLNKAEAKASSGEAIFKANCAGCHRGGQNLIKKEMPIIGSEVIKETEDLKAYLSVPHPPMPTFEKIASDNDKATALQEYLVTLK